MQRDEESAITDPSRFAGGKGVPKMKSGCAMWSRIATAAIAASGLLWGCATEEKPQTMLLLEGFRLAASATPTSSIKPPVCSCPQEVAPSTPMPNSERGGRTACVSGTCSTVVLPDPAETTADSPAIFAEPTAMPRAERGGRIVCASATCSTVVLPDPAGPNPDTRTMSAGTMPKATVTKGTTQTYVVKEGDTLIKIAKQYYGDGNQWSRIQTANPQIKNPSKLKVGEKLTIPA